MDGNKDYSPTSIAQTVVNIVSTDLTSRGQVTTNAEKGRKEGRFFIIQNLTWIII